LLSSVRGYRCPESRLPQADGSVTEKVTDVKDGIFRELEVDVLLDLNTSVAFFTWYAAQINRFRKTVGMSDQDWSKIRGDLNAALSS
jgi:hypothetical protein